MTGKPTADVTIPISLAAGDTGKAKLSVDSLVFTPDNFNVPQTVTVTGGVDSGDFTITTGAATSTDAAYSNFIDPLAKVTGTNAVSAGVMFSKTTGLTTDQDGGTATFTIKLTGKPTAPVTIALTSSATGRGTVPRPPLPSPRPTSTRRRQ